MGGRRRVSAQRICSPEVGRFEASRDRLSRARVEAVFAAGISVACLLSWLLLLVILLVGCATVRA